MRRFPVYVSLLALFAGTFAFVFLRIEAFANHSRTQVTSLTAGNYHIEVGVNHAVALPFPSHDWWGTETNKPPSTFIGSIKIRKFKEEIAVPVSAVSGLAEISRIKATATKKGCVLEIAGADGGESYRSGIIVEGNRVVERDVKSGEFPDERWEHTQYHYIPDDGR